VVVLGYRLASRDAETPRSNLNRPVLTADQARNFARQKPELFGSGDPAEVSVDKNQDGRWRVRLRDASHVLQPMSEPEWQDWLSKQQPAQQRAR
jgi:hypothetical protein